MQTLVKRISVAQKSANQNDSYLLYCNLSFEFCRLQSTMHVIKLSYRTHILPNTTCRKNDVCKNVNLSVVHLT